MSAKRRVLVICTGNSARSQMAEGLVNALLGEQWQAWSAGTKPAAQVHPLAVVAMAELGIDISHQRPKSVDLFIDRPLDAVITVCDVAAKTCPLWLGMGRVTHIGFPDPATATGNEDERLAVFRAVRDDIRARLLEHLRGFA